MSNNYIVNDKKIIRCIFTLFGIVATMPVLQLFTITAFVWGLLGIAIITVIVWLKNDIKVSKKNDKSFYGVFISMILSYIVCFFSNISTEWKNDLMTSFIQLCAMMIFFIFVSTKKGSIYGSRYIKGVYISSIIQLIWGYIQFIANLVGVDANAVLFNDIFRIGIENPTQYQNGHMKISGMCWNAGNLAPLVLFGFCYSKNIIIKSLFLILALISGSRTMLLGMIVCLFISFCISAKNYNRVSSKKTLSIFVVIMLLVGIMIIEHGLIEQVMEKIIAVVIGLASLSSEGSGSTHMFYYSSVLETAKKNNMINNIFGYGPGCSGYPMSKFWGYYIDSEKWCLESDYINHLWNYGIFGFTFYYYWYLKNILKSIKLDIRYVSFFGALLFEGILYNVTFNWVLMLLIAVFAQTNNKYSVFNSYMEERK